MFIFVILAICGGCFAIYGAVSLVRTRNFLRRAQRAEGLIVRWRTEPLEKGRTHNPSRYPTLRFTTLDGRTIETEADVAVTSPPADEEPVSVLYDPADPYRARLSTAGGRGYPEGLLFMIGGLLLAVGPFLLSLM